MSFRREYNPPSARWPSFRLASCFGMLIWLLYLATRHDSAYFANDDVAIEALLSGDFTGDPNPRSVFLGAILSLSITLLYRIFNGLPIYGIYLFVSSVVCFVVLLSKTLAPSSEANRRRIFQSYVVVLFLFGIAPFFVLMPSFTSVAFLYASAGFILLVDRIGSSTVSRSKFDLRSSIWPAALIFLGIQTRFDVLIPLLLFCAPVALLTLLRPGDLRRAGVNLFLGVFVLLLIGGLCSSLASATLFGSDYDSYLSANQARGSVHGTPRGYNWPPEVGFSTGWVGAEAGLFQYGFIDDSVQFSLPKLSSLEEATEGQRNEFDPVQSLTWLVDYRLDLIGLTIIVWILSLALSSRMCSACGQSLVVRVLFLIVSTLSFPVIFLSVFFYLSIFLRTPNTVLVPLIMFTMLAITFVPRVSLFGDVSSDLGFSLPDSDPNFAPLRFAAFISLSCVALSGFLVAQLVSGDLGVAALSGRARDLNSALTVQVSQLSELLPADTPAVIAGAGLVWEGVDPFDRVSSPLRNPFLIPTGWLSNSPMLAQRRAKVGLTSSRGSLEDLAKAERIVLVGSSTVIGIANVFIADEFGTRRTFVPTECVVTPDACLGFGTHGQ